MARTERMGNESILELLSELADRLAARGESARIYVVGGAAISLRYYPDGHERRATDDIDAVFSPVPAVRDVVDEIGRERNLSSHWFNDAARGYLPPHETPDGERLFVRDGVEVLIAPAHLLLAMKLRACRLGRDDEDIAVLLRLCSITSMAEADRLVDRAYHGEERIPPSRRSVVEACFGAYVLTRTQPTMVLPPIVRDREPPESS